MTSRDAPVKEILLDDSEDYNELIMKDRMPDEASANQQPGNNGMKGMPDVDNMDPNNVKVTKMEDKKRENEVMDKKTEVGTENKSRQ
jgi:hypothetical protein